MFSEADGKKRVCSGAGTGDGLSSYNTCRNQIYLAACVVRAFTGLCEAFCKGVLVFLFIRLPEGCSRGFSI